MSCGRSSPVASSIRSCSCSSPCFAATWRVPAAAKSSTLLTFSKSSSRLRSASAPWTNAGHLRGGDPLMHPQIGEIVEGLVARKKYIYLCTNALLLKERLHLFKPSKYL